MAIDWNITLEDTAKILGGKIFEATKEAAGDYWDDIEESNKDQIRDLSNLLAQLKLRELVGEDVSDLVNHIESQVSDLEFSNKSIGDLAMSAFWLKVLEITGSIIFSVARKAIGI